MLTRWLVEAELSSYDNIHVLGSSLGAQAAGYVGYYTGQMSEVTLGLGVTSEHKSDLEHLAKDRQKYSLGFYIYPYFPGGRLARITGLDPSGPLFYSVSLADK